MRAFFMSVVVICLMGSGIIVAKNAPPIMDDGGACFYSMICQIVTPLLSGKCVCSIKKTKGMRYCAPPFGVELVGIGPGGGGYYCNTNWIGPQ